ncbi:hypothetical protein ACLKA7_000233 [Drosophila subpalustris]
MANMSYTCDKWPPQKYGMQHQLIVVAIVLCNTMRLKLKQQAELPVMLSLYSMLCTVHVSIFLAAFELQLNE